MTLYLRRRDRDTYHFHPSCPHFQRLEVDATAKRIEIKGDKRPTDAADLCNLCRVKERREKEA